LIHPLCGLRHLCAVALRQGRYKAILVDGEALGAVCHYIHLNPVRAGLVEASCLEQYADSSFAGLWYPRRRRSFESPELALECAGGLLDTPAGRRKYRDYLGWLSETDEEAKRLGFEDMTKSWAKGTAEFKRSIIKDLKDEQVRKVVELDWPHLVVQSRVREGGCPIRSGRTMPQQFKRSTREQDAPTTLQ